MKSRSPTAPAGGRDARRRGSAEEFARSGAAPRDRKRSTTIKALKVATIEDSYGDEMDGQRAYRIAQTADPSAGRSRQTDREARRAHRHRQGCAGRSEDLPRTSPAVPGRGRVLGKPNRRGPR